MERFLKIDSANSSEHYNLVGKGFMLRKGLFHPERRIENIKIITVFGLLFLVAIVILPSALSMDSGSSSSSLAGKWIEKKTAPLNRVVLVRR